MRFIRASNEWYSRNESIGGGRSKGDADLVPATREREPGVSRARLRGLGCVLHISAAVPVL